MRRKKLAVLAVTTPLSVLLAPVAGHAAASGAPASASAPDDVIAYSVFHNLSTSSEAVTNADGSGQHTVAPPGVCYGRDVAEMVYSPNGRKAAFMCDGGSAVYVANADLARPVSIYTAGGSLAGMAWAPDSSTVYISVFQNVVASPGFNGTTTVAARADGSGASPVPGADATVTSVGPDGTLCLGPDSVELLHPGSTTPQVIVVQGENGVLSPDGTRVAYKNTPAGTADYVPSIVIHTLNGAAGDVTIPVPAGTLRAITWSPDSTRIAFSVDTGGSDMRDRGGQLWTADAGPESFGGATKLVDLPAPNIIDTPSWHSGPISATPRGVLARLGGADRIATSVAVAHAAYGPGQAKAQVAVLSRDDSFADALAGNALAAEKGGPLLLTASGRLDPRVADELKQILAPGATVYVLGGTGALSSQIDSAVRGLGLIPHRIGGVDRFGTATRIAAEISPHPRSVLVATGQNFPDALAAGAAAANDPQGGVVVLTDGASMPAETKAYLSALNVSQARVYGVGGQAVTALGSVVGMGGRFTPLSGPDRYSTDLAVAANTMLFPAPAAAGIATAANWPDALSGGAFVGARHAPLLLVDNNGSTGDGPNGAVDAWLSRHATAFSALTIFGGPSVVQPSIEQAVGDAAFGQGNWDAR